MLPNAAYDWPMITGEQLRDARLRAGYRRQSDLAKALQVSTRTVTSWENSHVSPREEAKVRRLLWPGPAPLSAYDDWELLSELGRRLTSRRDDPPPTEEEIEAIPGVSTGKRGPRYPDSDD